MENKTRSRVLLAITLFSAIVLAGTVFVCARRAGEEVTQRSFDELTTATKDLAKDINNAVRTDQIILSAMAELIAGQDEDDLDSVLRIMNTFSLDKTFVSTVALLRPDGTVLLTDGVRYDVSDTFDFETEAARGAYISDRVTSYFAPEKLVVRNVVPVKRDGETIAICEDAVLYDEQPTGFRQSCRQRLRWAKGYIQVFWYYGGRLLKGAARGSWSCFDMAMAIMPAFVLTCISILANVTLAAIGLAEGAGLWFAMRSLLECLGSIYLTLLVIGGITTATEWRQIHAPAWQKVMYTFSFPLFMFTYIPISFAALFMKVEWKPIRHGAPARLPMQSVNLMKN